MMLGRDMMLLLVLKLLLLLLLLAMEELLLLLLLLMLLLELRLHGEGRPARVSTENATSSNAGIHSRVVVE